MSERWAFLGCGQAAALHTRTLRSVAPAVERVYASRHGGKAAAMNGRSQGAGWFEGYQAALDDPAVTAALVLTPPALHLELAMAALRAGKHVIVEKPAFLDVAECDLVAETADAVGRQVLVAENYFYKPLAEVLREILASGRLGALRLIRLNALKYQRPAGWRAEPHLAGGSALFEGGIHWISLLANLGPELIELETEECGSPLTTVSTAHYADGATAVLTYSWETRTLVNGVQLSSMHGSRGSVTFESNGLFVREHGRLPVFPGIRDLAGYRAMFRDFGEALLASRPARFTLAHARRDIELIHSSARRQHVPGRNSWTS
jgi:predicted dehydrogenase